MHHLPNGIAGIETHLRTIAREWPLPAGAEVAAHQVRAVATLRDGTRLVANVRTKGLVWHCWPVVTGSIVQAAS